jgi:DNA-binding transcriptional regulator/RsmH inhibitor MraZ
VGGPTMLVKMDQKRRLSVPVKLAATVKAGDSFEATFDPEEGELTFRRINPQADWVELFEQCSVPMDDLPPRSRAYPKKLRL